MATPLDPETLWENLLSRRPELIRAAFASLEAGEQQSVLAHLDRMATQTGWHPEQSVSAQTALRVLKPLAK
jgi:hypothetical protein